MKHILDRSPILTAFSPFLLIACANTTSDAAPATTGLPTAFDAGWNGERVCEVLHEDDAIRVARCTFPPGVGHERHYHPPHWGYIAQGGRMQTTDTDGTIVRDLTTGASWWSEGTEWHEALNVGDETSIYVIVEPK